jgi:hypothetical protein
MKLLQLCLVLSAGRLLLTFMGHAVIQGHNMVVACGRSGSLEAKLGSVAYVTPCCWVGAELFQQCEQVCSGQARVSSR